MQNSQHSLPVKGPRKPPKRRIQIPIMYDLLARKRQALAGKDFPGHGRAILWLIYSLTSPNCRGDSSIR